MATPVTYEKMADCSAKIGKYFIARDTTANWLAVDPVLCAGLEVYDITLKNIKIGDGVSKFSELPYLIVGALAGGGIEITSSGNRTKLTTNSNWEDPLDPSVLYGWRYKGVALSAVNEHDYYIGADSATNSQYKYEMVTINGTLQPIRIPLQIR